MLEPWIFKRVIAVAIIAFGTSILGLATSLITLRKNKMGLGVEDLIGSNIFNILGILVVTSILRFWCLIRKLVAFLALYFYCHISPIRI